MAKMARIRSVKPEFFTSEQVVECSPTARLLFIGMWCFCDDRGVHPASLARLKMEVFPNDAFTSEQIQALINELLNRGLIVSYLVGSEPFWAIPTWRKHQKIEKPTYRYPAPPADQTPAKIDEQSTKEPAKTDATHRAVDDKSPKSRRTVGESSTPDRNGMESNGVERKGLESKGMDSSASKPKISTPPASPSVQSPAPCAQTPVRTSTGEPVTWAEAAEAMKSLKVSRIGAAIEAAKANDFAPPAVLALVDVLREVPADLCKSPAGALYDRLTTPGAAEWLATENWPWSSQAASHDAEQPKPDVYPYQPQPSPQNDLDRQRKAAQEFDRLILEHGEALTAMDDTALEVLILTSTGGTEKSRAALLAQVIARGRDSPLVHRTLLELMDVKKQGS